MRHEEDEEEEYRKVCSQASDVVDVVAVDDKNVGAKTF
jgi:hypothetical protein